MATRNARDARRAAGEDRLHAARVRARRERGVRRRGRARARASTPSACSRRSSRATADDRHVVGIVPVADAARPEGARGRRRREARRHGAARRTRSVSPATCSAASARSVRSGASPTVIDSERGRVRHRVRQRRSARARDRARARRPRASDRRDARGDRAVVTRAVAIRPATHADVDLVLALWQAAGAVPERDRRRRHRSRR